MLEHLKAVVQLATVLGPESHLLQPHVSKLLQVILKAQDLTVEHSFRAAEVLDTAVLPEHVKSRLRTALEERLRLPKRGGKVPRQDWCALPLYLPPPLMRTLTGEDGMFVKLDLLMQWLLSVGLRGPAEPTLGVITVLVNLSQKPALLHPQTGHDLFLRCKARARLYLDKASPWTSDFLAELPADPRLLPCPNGFFQTAPAEIVMPPIFADFLLLCNSLPLRSNHALLQKGGKKKTLQSLPSFGEAPLPALLPQVSLLASPAPPQLLAVAAPTEQSQVQKPEPEPLKPLLQAQGSGNSQAPQPEPFLLPPAAARLQGSEEVLPQPQPEVLPQTGAAVQSQPEVRAEEKTGDVETSVKAPAAAGKKRSLLDCVEDLKQARKQLKSDKEGVVSARTSIQTTDAVAAPTCRCRQKTVPAAAKPKPGPGPRQKKSKQAGPAEGDRAKETAAARGKAGPREQPEDPDALPVDRIHVVYAATKSYLVAATGGKKRLLVCVEEKMHKDHARWIGQLHKQGLKNEQANFGDLKQSLLRGREKFLQKARKA